MVMSYVTVTEEQATKIRPYLNTPVPEGRHERLQHHATLACILAREIPYQITTAQVQAVALGVLRITLNVVDPETLAWPKTNDPSFTSTRKFHSSLG